MSYNRSIIELKQKKFYNCLDLSSGSGVKRSADGAGDGGPNRFWYFLIAASFTALLPGKWLPLRCSSWVAFPLGWCPTKTEPALRPKQRRSRLLWWEAKASTVANRFPQVSWLQHFCNFNNLSQHSFSIAPLTGKVFGIFLKITPMPSSSPWDQLGWGWDDYIMITISLAGASPQATWAPLALPDLAINQQAVSPPNSANNGRQAGVRQESMESSWKCLLVFPWVHADSSSFPVLENLLCPSNLWLSWRKY